MRSEEKWRMKKVRRDVRSTSGGGFSFRFSKRAAEAGFLTNTALLTLAI